MPIPGSVARFNRLVTNRISGVFAGHLRGFAIVHHRGRRSGRAYATPVNVFRRADGYLIALTYGPDRDWVKNVVAAGSCELQTRGTTIRLGAPQLIHDPSRHLVPLGVREFLGLIGVTEFLHLSDPLAAPQPGRTGPSRKPT